MKTILTDLNLNLTDPVNTGNSLTNFTDFTDYTVVGACLLVGRYICTCEQMRELDGHDDRLGQGRLGLLQTGDVGEPQLGAVWGDQRPPVTAAVPHRRL